MRESDFLELQEHLSQREQRLRNEVLKFAIDKILVNLRLRKHKGDLIIELAFFSSDVYKYNLTGISIGAGIFRPAYRLEMRLDFNSFFPYMTNKEIKEFLTSNYKNVLFQDDERNTWRFWAIFKDYPEIDESVNSSQA